MRVTTWFWMLMATAGALVLGGAFAAGAQAQENAADLVVIPEHVLELLAETGGVDVEVVLREPHGELMAERFNAQVPDAQDSIAEGSIAEGAEPAAIDPLAEPDKVFTNFPLVVVRVESIEELEELAADPDVVEIGKTTLIVQAAQALPPHSLVELTGAPTRTPSASGAGIRVALLDSGVDLDHPDLQSAVVHEACYLDGVPLACPNGASRQVGPGSAEDDFGHGTAMAGIMTGDGLVSSPLGIAPDLEIEAFKVLNSAGFGSLLEVLAALDEIITNRNEVDLVALGLATSTEFPGTCEAVAGAPVVAQLRAAVQQLQVRGVVVVAPAGNGSNSDGMGVPACIPEVIGVTATGAAPARFGRSNVSTATSVAAPGAGIVSSQIGGGAAEFTGTSFAVPVVVGCAALLKESGVVGWQQLVSQLTTSPLNISNSPHAVPWLNCWAPCDGRPVSRIIAWGLDGTSSNDVITGSRENDVIRASAGDDIVCALEGADVILGGDGRDAIFAGDGNDVVLGGDGPDVLWGGFGRDTLRGGYGQDRIYGGGGSDFIFGEAQSDDLFGGSGNDLIDGDIGKDVLYGQGGNDDLRGGPNTDYLNGGAGSDTGDAGSGRDNPLIHGTSGCASIEFRISC